MEILDELIECEVGVIVPYIGPIVEFCLQVWELLNVTSINMAFTHIYLEHNQKALHFIFKSGHSAVLTCTPHIYC